MYVCVCIHTHKWLTHWILFLFFYVLFCIMVFLFLFFPWRQNFFGYPGLCPRTSSVEEVDLKLTEIHHLPLPPDCWDHCLAFSVLLLFVCLFVSLFVLIFDIFLPETQAWRSLPISTKKDNGSGPAVRADWREHIAMSQGACLTNWNYVIGKNHKSRINIGTVTGPPHSLACLSRKHCHVDL